MQCSKCTNDAVIFIKYSGEHLCRTHFIQFVEKRIKREFRAQLKLSKNMRIGVAISGGKDSSVALYVLHKILHVRKDIELHALLIDEGIKGYRNIAIEYARRLTTKLDVPLHIFAISEFFGHTIDAISSENHKLLPCSYCGVFRRHLLNIGAKKLNLQVLATGLNLDDTVQSVIMNIARGDIERLARMGPHKFVKHGLVPRIQPLRKIPEKEVLIYAILNNIEFYHGECPYAHTALRNEFREAILNWEMRSPGTRYAILKSYETLQHMMAQYYLPVKLNACERCGEPTTGKLCKACKLVEALNM